MPRLGGDGRPARGAGRGRPRETSRATGGLDEHRLSEIWDSADPYERYVGRWSRLVAREFLAWLAVPAGASWLDVGCGTGALAHAVVAAARPRTVTGVDPTDAYVRAARREARARFAVGDARALPVRDGAMDATVSGLVLNFVPQPENAVAEMRRATRERGIVAAYVWDYAGRMELMRHFWDTAVALDPAAGPLDEGVRFAFCEPQRLRLLFRSGGLREVTVRPIDAVTVFRDFEDYWSPFLGGQGPAPSYARSLAAAPRDALREGIRARLPIARDGSISLIARAWAIRGIA